MVPRTDANSRLRSLASLCFHDPLTDIKSAHRRSSFDLTRARTPRVRTPKRVFNACWPAALNPLFINEAKSVVFQQIAEESCFGMLALRFAPKMRKCHERHCFTCFIVQFERGGSIFGKLHQRGDNCTPNRPIRPIGITDGGVE